MDRAALLARLVREFGHPPDGARVVADDLAQSDGRVQAAFQHWWNTGTLSDLCIEGFTAERLVREHGMRPIAAFLTLDWLAREPEQAIASLHKGHDRVTTRARAQ